MGSVGSLFWDRVGPVGSIRFKRSKHKVNREIPEMIFWVKGRYVIPEKKGVGSVGSVLGIGWDHYLGSGGIDIWDHMEGWDSENNQQFLCKGGNLK